MGGLWEVVGRSLGGLWESLWECIVSLGESLGVSLPLLRDLADAERQSQDSLKILMF